MVLDIKCVNVTITTKRYGSEISWTLGHCSNQETYGSYNEYSNQCCLSNGRHSLECKDSYGDGWHGGYIEVDEVKFCEDFTRGRGMTRDIMISGRKL